MQRPNLFSIVASVGIAAGMLAAGVVSARPAVAAPPAQQGAGDRIVGDWRPTDQDVTVRIFANNGQYLGAIVQAPDQQMINRELIRGLVYDPAMGT